MQTKKNKMTLEKDLEVGKEYWFDGNKINYGVFHSFEKDKTPLFTPIVNNTYSTARDSGLVGFSPCEEDYWQEKEIVEPKS